VGKRNSFFTLEGIDMFSRFFGGRKSQIANRPVQIESLEGRRLLSASSIGSDVLGLDSSSQTQDLKITNFVTESTKIIKVEGTYLGHYQSKNYGQSTINFIITHDTHTGHFVGTVEIARLGTADVKGTVKASHHIDVSITDNSKESGTFTGTVSHTGGSFYGSYTVTGTVNDTGTYHVGKA
jgi:hypothetical protein